MAAAGGLIRLHLLLCVSGTGLTLIKPLRLTIDSDAADNRLDLQTPLTEWQQSLKIEWGGGAAIFKTATVVV